MALSSLPNEIIGEIIVRAYDPSKQLRALGCVCKFISVFTKRDDIWKHIIIRHYSWASTVITKEYRDLAKFIQPQSAVEGLQILLTSDKDTVKYGEEFHIITTLKNDSTDPIKLFVGRTNSGMYFENGADLELYLEPRHSSKRGKSFSTARLCGTGARDIIINLQPGEAKSVSTPGILKTPEEQYYFADKLVDPVPRTKEDLRFSFGRHWKLPLDVKEYTNDDEDEDIEEPSPKRHKSEPLLPEKFTVYIRYKYEMRHLRNQNVLSYRLPYRSEEGIWSNITYSNVIPITIDLSSPSNNSKDANEDK